MLASEFFTVETLSPRPLLRALLHRAREPPRPPGRLHDQLLWRADDDSPTVAAFVELAGNVFAES
jgi:hypothetical protein